MESQARFEFIWSWFKHFDQNTRSLVALALFLAILFLSGSIRSIAGPMALMLVGGLLTLENRTLTLSGLLLAAGAGYVAFLPVAAILASPLILLIGQEAIWVNGIFVGLEASLLAAGLVALSLWPQSRLRYTGSILDFAVLGLYCGAGLECGIILLEKDPLSYVGLAWGILPQLPGMLGHPQLSIACSSPATWGLLFGLGVGLTRYLIGPDLGSHRTKMLLGGLGGLLLLWIIGERLAYITQNPKGFWNFLYVIDLKGRLLTYVAGLTTAIVIVVEWLLLKDRLRHPEVGPDQGLLQVWQQLAQVPWKHRLVVWQTEQRRRSLRRELALAEEIRPLLPSENLILLDQRVQVVSQMLKEGS